ncbi:MAG: signal peptidase I [Nibricoccus sp.]
MQFLCVKHRLALLFGPLAGLSILLLFSGCTTDPIAPQSGLPRAKALAMAQQTADAFGGRVFTIAPTGSMKPTLDENSVVTVEVVPFDDLRVGDIVIYRDSAGLPIVHRLHHRSGSRWIVLGDNNSSTDRETVTAVNLVGRVCAIFYTSSGASPAGTTALANR